MNHTIPTPTVDPALLAAQAELWTSYRRIDARLRELNAPLVPHLTSSAQVVADTLALINELVATVPHPAAPAV